MNIRNWLIAGSAVAALASGFSSAPAFAQAGAPANALDHLYRSLEDLRDEARANVGYRKPEWVCQHPSGPCVWKPGYWGPPPAGPGGPYIYVRPFGDAGPGGAFPLY